jgi:hypothetical protein
MKAWQKHGQFSAAQWQEWLDYESDINVGFLTGSPSGLLCLDIDDNEGMRLLDELEIPWKETWQYRTGRGLRVLFRQVGDCPSGIISKNNASLEVLGDGRQSVLPPSIHPNGRQYQWVVGRSPKDCGLCDDTRWVRFLGGGDERLAKLTSNAADPDDWERTLSSPPGSGNRNIWFTSLAGRLLSPGGLSPEECEFWLRLYNKNCLSEPLGENEIRGIVASVSKSETRTRQSGEREIRRLMVEYGLNHADAETMWRNMK